MAALIVLQAILLVAFCHECKVIGQNSGTILAQLDKCANHTRNLFIDRFAWQDIPMDFADRFNLETVGFSNAQPCKGTFNFSKLTSVNRLELRNVGIKTLEFHIPNYIGELDISGNNIQDLSFSIVLNAQNLYYLNADRNRIKTIDVFKLLRNISVLMLNNNNISSVSIDFSMEFSKLVQLFLYGNPIKNLVFTAERFNVMEKTRLINMFNQNYMTFSESLLDDLHPIRQGANSAIVDLWISYLGTIEDVLSQIRKLDNLISLEISDFEVLDYDSEPLKLGNVRILSITSQQLSYLPKFARNNLIELYVWNDQESTNVTYNRSIFPHLKSLVTYNPILKTRTSLTF
ncbi:hypothetical protein ACOME3_005498 [Neoechinorhynchus agilis]